MTAIVRRFASLEQYSPAHHSRTSNRRIFGPEDGIGDLLVVRGTLEPGGRADPHFHKECDQLLFVIAGSCRIRLGETDEVLGENDSAFLPRAVPHLVDVLGEDPLELLITYLPALQHGDTHPL